MRRALFAYGSLVSPASASATLGREVEPIPARLHGWRREFSLARDNRTCEKTFARADGGDLPEIVLALNLNPDPSSTAGVNGALLAVAAAEVDRLDRREMRYDRIDVTAAIETRSGIGGLQVFAYVAKPEHFAPAPPAGAVILSSYVREVESAFAALGEGQLEEYQRSTQPSSVERIEGKLVGDRIPDGNPRRW